VLDGSASDYIGLSDQILGFIRPSERGGRKTPWIFVLNVILVLWSSF
jgi:hypothetical protein